VAPAESLIRKVSLNVLGKLLLCSPGEELDARNPAAHISSDKHDEDLYRRTSPGAEPLSVPRLMPTEQGRR
jgi:hypothetical protein